MIDRIADAWEPWRPTAADPWGRKWSAHLYRRAGLRTVDIEATIKTGRPGSAVWEWLTTYFMGVMDRYATFKPFSRAQARPAMR